MERRGAGAAEGAAGGAPEQQEEREGDGSRCDALQLLEGGGGWGRCASCAAKDERMVQLRWGTVRFI